MTLSALADVLFLAGLVGAAALAWFLPGQGHRPGATGISAVSRERRSACPARGGSAAYVVAVWAVGLVAVHSSLAARGHAWLAKPVREWRFELRSPGETRLQDHHQIIFPTPEERLPPAFKQLDGPVAMGLRFALEPDGAVREVNVLRSSGSSTLDGAVASAVAKWRFGPLPDDYPWPPAGQAGRQQQAAETVELKLMNRYQLLLLGREAALVASVFMGLWLLTTWLLPGNQMLLAAGCLAGLGWLMVWRLAPDLGEGRADLPMKQASFLLASIALVWVGAAVVGRWRRFGWWVARLCWVWVAMGVILLLVTRFTPLGTDLGTGHRLWLRTPWAQIQTVEVVKLLLVLFVAGAAYPAAFSGALRPQGLKQGGAVQDPLAGQADGPFRVRGAETPPYRGMRVVRMRPWIERYRAMIGAFALVLAALILMKDFGPMLLLALVLLFLLSAQGHHRQSVFGLVALLALLTASYLIGTPGRWRERVDIWRNPWQETASDSRQLREGREHLARVAWATSAGGVVGTGLGQGMPTDIKAVESDFMFAAIAEELGWVGGLATLALMLALVAGGLSLASRREDGFEKMLISGVALLLGAQAALTIGGNLGLWPLTGITLPFVSYGGSSLLVNFIALGMCLGVAGRSSAPGFPSGPPGRAGRGFLQGPRGGDPALQWPLPPDLSQRMNRSLRKLELVFVLLFAALAVKLGWLQWPSISQHIAPRYHTYADGSRLQNPRLDTPAWVERGRFLDRDGQPIANPQQYVHLLGVEGGSGKRTGLQAYLNDPLTGRLKPRGSPLLPWEERRERGYDIVLTLDQELQAKAYQLLEESGHRGCIVGIVPQTGEVVIAANWPPLETGGTDSQAVQEWLAAYDSKPSAPPFCYRQVYAPGSTFKTVIAAAALETGAMTSRDVTWCEGSYRAGGGRPIRDWQGEGGSGFGGHGGRTLREALIVSCNSIYAQVGVRLGWDRLYRFAADTWFDAPIPLLPEEWRKSWGQPLAGKPARPGFEAANSQLVAGKELASELSREERDPAYLAQTALGQRDVRMTPLHMALWAAAIANDGEMMAPSLVQAIQDENGKRVWESEPRVLARAMSQDTARELAAMMEDVVESRAGTGHPAWTPGLRIAGKTGTPQAGLGANDAVFIAFGPVEQPRLALAVVLEDTAGGGGKTAGPIVRHLMETAR